MSQPLILGIAICAAAVVCFLLLVIAAIIRGHFELTDEELESVALDEEARKAGM
jgi:Na+/melibiose symporter-like transporter